MNDTDRRSEPRIETEIWVELARANEIYVQRVSNLSLKGMSLTQTIPLPLGTRVTLTVTLSQARHAFACEAEIVAVQSMGMGVQFLAMSDDARAQLEDFVGRAQRLSL